jgi:predicted ATPase
MAKAKSKMLRFTHINLENWRNFAQVDVELQRRGFLIGPNASGKSNLLDVFRFLRELVSVGGGFQEAVRKRGGVSSLRCLAARRHSDIVVRIFVGSDENLHTWEYVLRFNQDNLRRPIIKQEWVAIDGSPILERPDDKDKEDSKRLTQTYIEQVYANQPFREVANFFSTVRYLHIVPQLVRDPDRSVGRKQDPYGGDFLDQIARTPERIQKSRMKRIENALRVAVPQLKTLEFWRDGRGIPHLRGKHEHWRPQAWQTEDQFSDGTLRLLGLLWATLDGSGPLLLEEPELSLHPEAVRFIPQMFARIQQRTAQQVLISTHSSDLLRDEGIGVDETLLLQPSGKGTTVQTAASFGEIKALLEGGMSLADAVIPRTRPENVEQLILFGE